MNARAYQAIIGVLVLVIIILAWRLAASSAAPAVTSTSATATTTASSESAAMNNTSTATAPAAPNTSAMQVEAGTDQNVAVSDQPAGNSVAVDSVTLQQTGWVAIRDSSGRTLGAARFGAGAHTNVSVPLLRATEPGQTYQALLYVDTGDTGVFDLHTDTLITNPDGTVAGTTFTTTAAAATSTAQ